MKATFTLGFLLPLNTLSAQGNCTELFISEYDLKKTNLISYYYLEIRTRHYFISYINKLILKIIPTIFDTFLYMYKRNVENNKLFLNNTLTCHYYIYYCN